MGVRPPGSRRPTNSAGDRVAQLRAAGLRAFHERNFAEAVRKLESAVELRPQDAPLLGQLGAAYRAAGRVAEAITTYGRAAQLDPGLAMVQNNLGNALRDTGDFAGSAQHLREAARLEPNYAEAHHNLALTLIRVDQLVEAERSCLRALELRPAYADALATLSRLRARRGDYPGALKAIGEAQKIDSRRTDFHLEGAAILQALGRFDEAEREVAAAASLAPDLPDVQLAVGRELEQRGDQVGAAVAFRKALAARPDVAGPYLCLSGLSKDGLTDEELARAEREALDRHHPMDERASFCFALARAWERRKDFDRAFGWARRGNDIESSRTNYSRAETRDFVNRSISAFSAADFPKLGTSSSQKPIFIVGFPRSGTTLVEQIIAAHPQAAAGGELVDIPEMVKALPVPDSAYPEAAAALNDAEVDDLAGRYLERLDRIAPDALRVTDKLPFNFRHLGFIARLLPKARVIHCRRDPRDVAVSCFFIKFHRPISFAQSLHDFGAYWREYLRLMDHWRRALPLPILDLDYETVVAHPNEEIRRIIEFAGLPWDERCLRFHDSRSIVRTASVNQIRRPIYAASVGRWRNYAKHLAPLYRELAASS
jgi:Flp pilus assembly protein TadD